jgi:hypothetical protein
MVLVLNASVEVFYGIGISIDQGYDAIWWSCLYAFQV